MKKLILGILIGIFLSITFFEIIHKTVEVDGWRMCATIYDKLTEKWHPDFIYGCKVVYKTFAIPTKTVWIYFSESDYMAQTDGLGEDICYGNWKIKKLK